MMGILCGVMIVVVLVCLLLGNKERIVGGDIATEDITEFVYTQGSSTASSSYQRYRFYIEAGKYLFYHEKREGKHWPLTEEDVTLSGSRELTEEEWTEFIRYLQGGRVKKRVEHTEAGGAGPWMYLYWDGDGSKYQEFSFASYEVQRSFQKFCEALVKQ